MMYRIEYWIQETYEMGVWSHTVEPLTLLEAQIAVRSYARGRIEPIKKEA